MYERSAIVLENYYDENNNNNYQTIVLSHY